MTSLHEPHPVAVDEEGALAAHGLGDERLLAAGPRPEPQHRRVELDELDVGHHRAGAQRRGHAVAGGDRRVGRRGVDLSDSAGGQHDGTRHGRTDAVHLALTDDVQGHAADAGLLVLQQVHDEGVLDHLDAGVVLHTVQRGDERAGDLLARGVAAGVGDPVLVVPTLAGQPELALVVEVELGAEGDELADPLRPLVDESRDGRDVAHAAARHEGVVQVLLRASPPGRAPRRCRPAPTGSSPR